MSNRCVSAVISLVSTFSLGLALATPVSADVIPVTTSGQAKAYALTFPNQDHPWDIETWFGGAGDYSASAYQFDSTESISPGTFITCEVTSNAAVHIDSSGATGTASLRTDWAATNPFPVPNSQSGVFDSENFVMYSFVTDTPGTITIDLTCTSDLPNVIPLDPGDIVNYAMAINHTVTFNGTWTELLLNDQQTLVYAIGAGFHQLKLERHPNSGITPWPNCDVYSTTAMEFTIETGTVLNVMGDMDCDEDVDFDDIPAMTMALLDPGLYAEIHGCIENGDFTEDEVVDGADLQAFTDVLVGE
jgi:hypothetical protein